MNFFQKILQKAAPVMSAVQSLFFYVIIFSIVGYYVDKKFDTTDVLIILKSQNIIKKYSNLSFK